MFANCWKKSMLAISSLIISSFSGQASSPQFNANAIAQQYMQQNGIGQYSDNQNYNQYNPQPPYNPSPTPSYNSTTDACTNCISYCRALQPNDPASCISQNCASPCTGSPSNNTPVPTPAPTCTDCTTKCMSDFPGTSAETCKMDVCKTPCESPLAAQCSACTAKCMTSFPGTTVESCKQTVCTTACTAPTRCQTCKDMCQKNFPGNTTCFGSMCKDACAPDCPDGWTNKGGKCYSPQGNSKCEGMIQANMTPDQKKGMAIWCLTDWPSLGISHAPDLYYDGPGSSNVAGQGAAGLLTSSAIVQTCQPANFNQGTGWQDIKNIINWTNQCKVNYKGINYEPGEPVPFPSNKTCPDGWTSDSNGNCTNTLNVPSWCGTANFNNYTDANKLQWAIQCGVPWKAVGLVQPCPDGWRKQDQYSCARQGAQGSPIYMNGYSSIDQLKQWAMQNNLKWAGVTYPYKD